jgi:DNA-binding transcriptional LysR family regulator
LREAEPTQVNLDLYRVFRRVAKSGSISSAARQLYLTQPAVTQAVKRLEEQLGVTLFHRTSRGTRLTPEGSVLFHYVDQAYGFIETGERKLSEMRSMSLGDITIAAGDTLCKHYLVPHLRAFHETYPGVGIHVLNRTTPETIALLRAGKVDVGIVNLPIAPDHTLTVRETLTVHDAFVAGERYKQLCAKPVTPRELATYPLLLLERGGSTRTYLDAFFASQGVELKPEIELGSLDLLERFATIGLGVAAVVREFAEEGLATGHLHEVKLTVEIPPRRVGVVTARDVPLSQAAATFVSLLERDTLS